MNAPSLIVTPRQAAAFALQRSGISQPFREPLAAVRSAVAIQAQYEASIPIAIHARCPQAPSSWTEQALVQQRTLVKTWCLRGTLHALAADDLALVTGAFEGYHHSVERVMQRMCGMDAPTWHAIEQETMRALARGPLDRAALHAAVPDLQKVPWAGWGEDVKGLAYRGKLLMVGSKGARPVFARRDTWLPSLDFHPVATTAAHKELVIRYLHVFAPAALTDITHWSGLPVAVLREVLRGSPSLFTPVIMRGNTKPLIALAEDAEALTGPLPDLPKVSILPKFDALLLAWTDPSRLLDSTCRSAVFRPAGQIEATVLVRGRVAAIWRMAGSTARITPLRHLSSTDQRHIETAFEQLGAWQGNQNTAIAWQE